MAIYKDKTGTKDGRKWYFRTYYTNKFGQRKQHESKRFLTKKEAQESEIQFITNTKTKDQENVNIMFEEMYNEWLKFKQRAIKSTTYYGLHKRLDKHILSFFKSYKLHYIKINVINEWYEYLNKTGMGLEYQNKIISSLKEILRFAADNYNFDTKVISKIQKYKIDTPKEIKKEEELNYWTKEEFDKFISNVDDQLYFVIFNFLYYTGLRLGEMIALRWKHLDLKGKTIIVVNNFTNKVENQEWAIITPKTENSNRNVLLDDEIVKLLKIHYEHEKKIYGFNEDEMFLFGNIKHIAPTTFSRKLKKYINITNDNIKNNNQKIKTITPHGFRHSHVSLLINLGCDSRIVADRIGDTVSVVEKVYYHLFPNKKTQAVDLINKLKYKKIRGK